MFKPLQKGDPRFNGWIVKQRPKGRDRSYTYLYWRVDKKLRKQYVPLDQVSQVRKAFRQERQRKKRAEEAREVDNIVQRLYSNIYFFKGYINLFHRYAVFHEPMSDGDRSYHFPPESDAALDALIYRSLRRMGYDKSHLIW